MTDRQPRQNSVEGSTVPWPRVQWLGAILWPSFFAAAMATVVFFIFVDPLALRDMTFPNLEISRMGGYTVAFFMFWAATAASSLFTALLLRPVGRRGGSTGR